MDGRPQRKVADYLATSFGARHLDTITTAGMVRHLVTDTEQTPAIMSNLDLSIRRHGSRHIAVVAHHDCVGNPLPDKTQKEQVSMAVARVSQAHPDTEVLGLWVDAHWIISRVWPT
jgi:carbonic anhydrase